MRQVLLTLSSHFLNIYQQLIASLLFSIEPTSSAKVLELMLKLSKKKAIGLDSISSQLIKISAPLIVAPITEIFNYSILTGIFPDE